jgi:hypothetical protein
MARSTRQATADRCGGNPLDAGNVRTKWEGLRWTTAARSRTVTAASRCSSMDAIEGARSVR